MDGAFCARIVFKPTGDAPLRATKRCHVPHGKEIMRLTSRLDAVTQREIEGEQQTQDYGAP